MKPQFLSLFLAATTFLVASALSQGAADPVFSKWREKVEPAVEDALDYLAGQQNEDGSFPHSYGRSVGIPALAGMAFLSKGHLPTDGPYAQYINRSIDWVVSHQKESGVLDNGDSGHGPMYAHNIATLFLSEVSGMVDPGRQEKIDQVLPKALELILRAQHVKKDERNQGGWRFHPNSNDSDTSCSGWALMALRSAKLNGAAIPDEAIAQAVEYLQRHQDVKKGTFGYSGREDHARSLTGMGLLCLELCGRHGQPETTKAADYVLKTFRELPGGQYEQYGIYYNAQGLFQIGGHYWSEFAPWMYEHYLAQQQADGSWQSKTAGPAYGTAMMVLAFTVPHRQLPIYQRDETVDEGL